MDDQQPEPGRRAVRPPAGRVAAGEDTLVTVISPAPSACGESPIDYLRLLGADGISHPGGNLFDHLRRTAALLDAWGASSPLVLAGLYHAVYGTDGFPVRLRQLDQRHLVAAIIGGEAEAIVYRYAACERAYFYSHLGVGEALFRDRFTGQTAKLSGTGLAELVELTVTNEVDVLTHDLTIAEQNGAAIAAALRPAAALATPRARRALGCAVGTAGILTNRRVGRR